MAALCHGPPCAEREREASNLIKSNGGRWKHGDAMVAALKVCGATQLQAFFCRILPLQHTSPSSLRTRASSPPCSL